MSDLIEIKIDDKGFRDVLKGLSVRMRDMSPLMRKLAGIMHHAVEENFEREGRPQWTALKSSTIRQRQKAGYWDDKGRGFKSKILQRRGELAASISQRYDSHSAIVGTNKSYAAVHQFGLQGTIQIGGHKRTMRAGSGGRGGTVYVKAHSRPANIPRREFLKATDGDLSVMEQVAVGYLI